GHLLRRRVDPYVALELALCWNATRCRPPLPEAEVLRTVDSIARAEARRRGVLVSARVAWNRGAGPGRAAGARGARGVRHPGMARPDGTGSVPRVTGRVRAAGGAAHRGGPGGAAGAVQCGDG